MTSEAPRPSEDHHYAAHHSGTSPRRLPTIPGRPGCVALLTSALLLSVVVTEQPSIARPVDQAPPPTDFAIVFTMGYGGDLLPQDPAGFDALAAKLAAGGFNTVLASYEGWRLPILERHGLKLMVDMLDERYHVYRQPAEAEKVARALRGDERVWGYHLFSDTTSDIVAGRDRDAKNLHAWDPTHPTFVGYKRDVRSAADAMTEPDVLGFYNYHWVRDRSVHFHDLQFFGDLADRQQAQLSRWVWVQSGRANIGNPNRNRYTIYTSLAFGLKSFLWFIGQQMIDPATWEWNAFGQDVIATNQGLRHIGREVMALHRVATYSTATTRTMNNDPKDPAEPAIPPPLAAVPADGRAGFTVPHGEAVIGLFGDTFGQDVLVIANHNAYLPQDMILQVTGLWTSIELLDRESGRWMTLTGPGGDGRIAWTLDAGYADLVRISRDVGSIPTATVPSTPSPSATATVPPTAPATATDNPTATNRVWLPYACKP